MSERAFAAAAETGIGLTHLPVLYGYGGFGGTPAGQGQRRFLHELDDYLILLGTLMTRHEADPQVRIGIAPHSLRAVTPELLSDAVTGLGALASTAPLHIDRKSVVDGKGV